MNVFLHLIVAVALLALPNVASAEENKQTDKAGSPAGEVTELDPVGKPANYATPERGHGPKLFVWWDDGIWYVRSTTEKKRHTFEGTIHVVGGKVNKVFHLARMEAGKDRDMVMLDAARATIRFRCKTKGDEDGFDFTVSPKAQSLQFGLSMDGQPHPKVIVVGAKGQGAPNATFTLPAHPHQEATAVRH